MSAPTRYLNSAALAQRYGWSMRTVARRVKDPLPGFPTPILINGRWLWPEDGAGGLEDYEKSLARDAASNRKAA